MNKELIEKVESIRELEELMEEIKVEVETLKDTLKSVMMERNTEELDLDGRYIVRWTSVISQRFDTKRFKENFGSEVYNAYTKEVSSKRFSIA